MTPEQLEDESARPAPPSYPGITRAERAQGRRLAAIHDMYRSELAAVAHLMTRIAAEDVAASVLAPAVASTRLARNMAMFGTACGRDCALLQNHHDIEEQWMFPSLAERGGPALSAVLARLIAEHEVIHALIGELHEAATALIADQGAAAFDLCHVRFQALDRAIRSHFGYEERALEEPLGALWVTI